MIKYDLVPLPHFKRDLKRLKRKHILTKVFNMLHVRTKNNIKTLVTKYKDHSLKGNNKGYRELHLAPNILLKYQIHKNVLVLVKIESHKYVLK